MNTAFHPLVKQIIDILKGNNCWFETFEHEPVRTSEEAARVRTGYTIHQGAKAMIVRVRTNSDNKFVMLVYPADKKFDSKKVKQVLNSQDLGFATEEEVIKLTRGVIPGGIPPFGNLFGLEVYADNTLLENEKIIFNAGDRCFSIAIKTEDYINLVKPNIVSIV